MKILIVCSGNAPGFDFKIHQAFIYEQIESICKLNQYISYECFFVQGKGIAGYYKNLSLLKKKISAFNPDIVHAHGGHIGLLCALQRKTPVVVTYHGSDINIRSNRLISLIASMLCTSNIFVSQQLERKMPVKLKNTFVIPCGVDLEVFFEVDKMTSKTNSGIAQNIDYVLFSSSFDNSIKNSPLAFKGMIGIENMDLKEIKNCSRQQVNFLLNGAELLLLTSFSEGSPQIIKEAMACNCPIVATNVGDIKEVIGNAEGCYITSFDPNDVTEKIKLAIEFGKGTNARGKIGYLDNRIIAKKIIDVYLNILNLN
jgi:teichuronic acid biosynthesis glycosyltransferase TuaC